MMKRIYDQLMFAALLFLAVPAWAGDDQFIYSDQRNNGWQDYGWVPHSATNSPLHSGTNCMNLTPNGGYQAWWLAHDNLDTTAGMYTNVTFWINGGATGGQTGGVNALLGGAQGALPRLSIGTGGKLATNVWQQFTLSLVSLGVANKTNFNGLQFWSNTGVIQSNFFLDDITLTAAPMPASVGISVNATQTLRTVDARIFGVNNAAWDGYLPTAITTSVLNEIGNQALRWPGGSWGDTYHFTNEYAAFLARGYGCVTTNFMKLATNTGAQIFFIVNYGSAAPAEAGMWVKFCNVTNHWGVKYWEVGNENYGSWETDDNTNAPFLPHDPWTYATRFTNYYALMKAADPSIKIGAVVVAGENSYNNNATHYAVNARTGTTNYGWTPIVLATLKSLGVTPDFLIYHSYAPNNGDTDNLRWTKTWTSDAASLRQMLTDYIGAPATNTELVVTESGTRLSDRQYDSIVGGLFYADSTGQILKTEFNARLWWDLRNGRSTITGGDPALYGWRNYYDEGMIYNNAEPTNRYPVFYCAKLMKQFARGGDSVLSATSSNAWLSAYAVRRTNGSLSLLVINKSSVASLNAAFTLAGYTPSPNATVYSYGLPQDEAARTNAPARVDIATNSFTGAAASFARVFAPYSATVLSLSPAPPVLVVQPSLPDTLVLQLQGQPGVPYVIQSSTNLADWIRESTNKLAGGNFYFTNQASAATPAKFWRALWQP